MRGLNQSVREPPSMILDSEWDMGVLRVCNGVYILESSIEKRVKFGRMMTSLWGWVTFLEVWSWATLRTCMVGMQVYWGRSDNAELGRWLLVECGVGFWL